MNGGQTAGGGGENEDGERETQDGDEFVAAPFMGAQAPIGARDRLDLGVALAYIFGSCTPVLGRGSVVTPHV